MRDNLALPGMFPAIAYIKDTGNSRDESFIKVNITLLTGALPPIDHYGHCDAHSFKKPFPLAYTVCSPSGVAIEM